LYNELESSTIPKEELAKENREEKKNMRKHQKFEIFVVNERISFALKLFLCFSFIPSFYFHDSLAMAKKHTEMCNSSKSDGSFSNNAIFLPRRSFSQGLCALHNDLLRVEFIKA
jgi:hypothetical protein